MVAQIVKQIGLKTLINDVKEYIITLKLNSHITNDEDMSDLEETADTLITAFNQVQKDKINPSPIELVLNYLRDLPYEEYWYDKINMEQIIGVISMLDYEKDKIIYANGPGSFMGLKVAYLTLCALIVFIVVAMFVHYKLSIKAYHANVEVEFLSSVVKISEQIDQTGIDPSVPKVVSQVVAHDIKKDKIIKRRRKKDK